MFSSVTKQIWSRLTVGRVRPCADESPCVTCFFFMWLQEFKFMSRFLVRFSWLISWWFSLFVVTVEAHSTPLGICACLVISGNLVLQVSPLEFARMQGQPEDPKRKNQVFYNVVVPICQVFSLFIYLFLIELWSYMCQLTLPVCYICSSKIEKYLFTCDWKWLSQNIIM